MSQHMWCVFTDCDSGETFYFPYEAINHLEVTALDEQVNTTLYLRNGMSIKAQGSPQAIFTALAQQLGTVGETFAAVVYPPLGS